MSHKKIDISTQYTKEENKKSGRSGYFLWKREKETSISPKEFGMFIQKNGGKR